MKNFIVYDGTEYTLEWYFDKRGKSEAYAYYRELSEDRKNKIFHLFQKMGDTGKIFNKEKFRNEYDQIYAFKSQPDRFFCFFFEGAKVIITNAFEKKMERMPRREKEKAIKAREDYKKRCNVGDYYD